MPSIPSGIPSAMQSARNGLARYERDAGRAAEDISRSFELDTSSPDTVNAANASSGAAPATIAGSGKSPEYLDASLDLLVAQRAFSAQLRALETADRMTAEALDLERSPPRA